MRNNLYKKGLVVGIIALFIGVSITSSTGKIDREICKTTNFDGSLSGYVKNILGTPIEGALVRVHFHKTYEEDFSDSTGFYNITNIPICKCLKYTACSKENYKTKRVLLAIAEDTTRDFILISIEEMLEYDIELENNNEIEPLDDYEEVITHISGAGLLTWTKQKGELRGEVKLYGDDMNDGFRLFGLKRSNGRLEIFHKDNVNYIYAYRFIGYEYLTIYEEVVRVVGIAFGNIEWS